MWSMRFQLSPLSLHRILSLLWFSMIRFNACNTFFSARSRFPAVLLLEILLSRLFPSQLALCPSLCILLPSSTHPSHWLLLLHFGQSVCRSMNALSPFPRTFWKYHNPSKKMKADWGNKTNPSTCMCSSMCTSCEFACVHMPSHLRAILQSDCAVLMFPNHFAVVIAYHV